MKDKLVLADHMDATARRIVELGEEENDFQIAPEDVRSITSCPICGSPDIQAITQVYHNRSFPFFSTSACRSCHYTFRADAPSNDWFRKCWRQIETDEPEVFNPEIEKLRETRYAVYCDILSEHLPRGRVLDIGAAFGTGATLLREHGYEMSALEPEYSRATYLERKLGIPTHNVTLEDLKTDRPYDGIVFSQCLEHVDDPVLGLKAVVESLKPETGILYLEVPLLWYFVDWKDAFFMAHKSNFSEGNVLDLVELFGLEILDKRYLNMNSPTAPDVGLVLRRRNPAIVGTRPAHPTLDEGRDFSEILTLYRRGLPVAPAPEPMTALRYSVDRVSHFYHTVRFIHGDVSDNRDTTGFIEFKHRT